MSDIVQGLWIGDDVTRMERLSMRSFLANGHPYHLYTYARGRLDLPAGVVQLDAREIVPEDGIWQHAFGDHKGSLAGFSDHFRYSLLYQRGGVWADADLICLRPLDLGDGPAIGSEHAMPGITQPSTQLLRFPPGDPLLRACISAVERLEPGSIGFRQVGPELISRTVEEMGYEAHVLSADYACPVPWHDFYRPFLPEHGDDLMALLGRDDIHCLHLWHELVRRLGGSKAAVFPAESAYERLADRFGLGGQAQEDGRALGRDHTARMYVAAASDPVRAHDDAERARLLDAARAADPALPEIYLEEAAGALDSGDQARLAARLEAAPASVAAHPYVLAGRAVLRSAEGDPVAGRELLRAAVTAAVGESEVVTTQVVTQLIDDAAMPAFEGELRQAAAAYPECVPLLLAVGRICRRSGRRAEALDLFERAHALDPGSFPVAVALATELARTGRAEEALALAERLVEQRPGRGAWQALGLARRGSGDPAGAEEALRGALAVDPTFRPAIMELRDLLVEQGRTNDAIELLSAYVAARPSDAAAVHMLDDLRP